MPVKLTCTMRLLLDQPDVNHREIVACTAGLTLMRQAFPRVLTRLEQEVERACTQCSASTVGRDGQVPGQLRTRFDPVDLTRRQYRCRGCRNAFRPLDSLLALWQAVRLPSEFAGTRVSSEWVYQIAHSTGLVQVVAARAEVQRVVASRQAVNVEQVARGLTIALDGRWVKSREQPGGMECTVGVLATGRVMTGKTRRLLLDRRVVVTLARVEAIGAEEYREAERLGCGACREGGRPGGWGRVDRHSRAGLSSGFRAALGCVAACQAHARGGVGSTR